VIDARAADLIGRQIVRDGRSLLHYIDEAFPYTPAQAEHRRARIHELAQGEQEAVGRLIRFLHRQHVTPPFLSAFPSNFTTSNFVSLDHVLPALNREQERGIAQLERDVAALPDGEGRQVLLGYLEEKRRRLQELLCLGPAAPAAAAEVHT
jgi:hypothetical protein